MDHLNYFIRLGIFLDTFNQIDDVEIEGVVINSSDEKAIPKFPKKIILGYYIINRMLNLINQ